MVFRAADSVGLLVGREVPLALLDQFDRRQHAGHAGTEDAVGEVPHGALSHVPCFEFQVNALPFLQKLDGRKNALPFLQKLDGRKQVACLRVPFRPEHAHQTLA